MRTAVWVGPLLLGIGSACSQLSGSSPDDLKLQAVTASDGGSSPVFEVTVPAAKAASIPAVADDINPRLLRRFQPLRAAFLPDGAPAAPPALVDLGRMLYFDPRLSSTGQVSCNSCHPLDHYGATHEARSAGVNGRRGARNAPTTYNAAGHITQFWDGRASSVEAQVEGPLFNPDEMGMATPERVTATLNGIAGYRPLFQAAFPGPGEPVTLAHLDSAIGAFERQLVTPGRWDRYLAGDKTALSAKEKDGLKIFTEVGCMVCHTGALVGGSMYEKLGAVNPWPNQRDRGRGAITHSPGDEMMFKVPSLRNVAKTAPYFHDGSAETLEEAVRMMADYQLGEELSHEEIDALVAWLGALSGDLPTDYIQRPALPSLERADRR